MLQLPRTCYHDILAHCRQVYPKEACGLLAGPASAEDAVSGVAQVYPMTNTEDSPIGYAMDPKEQLMVDKQMRRRGQRMIGIYHSHTATEAYPSPVDVRLALSPDISYALVSLKDQAAPVFKSYRIDGVRIEPEAVTILEPRP